MVANVLGVAAFEVGDPMRLLVLVEGHDLSKFGHRGLIHPGLIIDSAVPRAC